MAWCGAASTGNQVSWSSWLSIYSSVTLGKSLAPKLICLPLLFKVGLTMVQNPCKLQKSNWFRIQKGTTGPVLFASPTRVQGSTLQSNILIFLQQNI